VLYVASIGGPAAAKVVKADSTPSRTPSAAAPGSAWSRSRRILADKPPPWLAKVMGQTPEERIRFEREEAWRMIDAERIEQIVAVVERAGLNEGTLSPCARSSPSHFTYCMDDDIGAVPPVREEAGFNLYLVDGQDHCMRFTADAERATGVVLAEVLDED
jgi:hypothetical protein